jgi:hypothetical protein
LTCRIEKQIVHTLCERVRRRSRGVPVNHPRGSTGRHNLTEKIGAMAKVGLRLRGVLAYNSPSAEEDDPDTSDHQWHISNNSVLKK